MNKQSLIRRFTKSAWIERAKAVCSNPKKLQEIAALVRSMLGKGGLRSVRSKLSLLAAYVRDVATGNYSGYNLASLIFIVATLLYVASPLDFVPDFLPAGLLDDATLIAWAFAKLKKELDIYAHHKEQSQTEELQAE
ncbi:MAG: DUF1232 domain-containing protein [Bacteroidaceae bacterium]|nr:DUF1232 domain-containing protein [Bacteroidaceae bacterium]